MFLVFGLLIAAGLAAFVATPLLSAEGAGNSTLPVDVTPLGDLKRRRLVVYENMKPMEPFIGQIGLFGQGPSGTVGDAADVQLRLLDLTGRRA
jgi:hypothetical protein